MKPAGGERFSGRLPRKFAKDAKVADALALAREVRMAPERHVKLFKNGRNQAVRIPREFELPGEDAIIRKEGDRLII